MTDDRMQVLIIKYRSLEREKKIYFISFILSLLFHMVFLLVFTRDMLKIDLTPEAKDLPEEVTIVFPENKPKTIVENINENNEIPEDSDLLSDFNSRAITRKLLDKMGIQPMSEGNIPFANLTKPNMQNELRNQFQKKKFSRDALSGEQGREYHANASQDQMEQMQQMTQSNESTTNNLYDQKNFSSDQLGDNLSLSTYAWEWAPYINSFKRKLFSVWFTPAAYHRLGLIHGYTVIEFTISREGKLTNYIVHEHNGHESLKQSSINAITSSFPFKPLPDGFPDENLTITARLIYPNLRRR